MCAVQMYSEETILVSNVGENIMLLKGASWLRELLCTHVAAGVERVFNARKAACATYCGVKDGKLIGMDEGEAEKHFKGIDESLQPEIEVCNYCALLLSELVVWDGRVPMHVLRKI